MITTFSKRDLDAIGGIVRRAVRDAMGVSRRDDSVAHRIAVLRSERGWTRAQLAAAARVSRQAVLNWESGRSVPTPRTTARLAAAFGVPESEIAPR